MARPAGAILALVVLALVPPAAGAQTSAYNSIGLEWTAGGDDGETGRAAYYEMRYAGGPPSGADSASIGAWWGGAAPVGGMPAPSLSGATDSVRVTGLTPGTTYYFVIRAVDDGGNRSSFSNIAQGSTLYCDAPTAAPAGFQATADTGRVDLGWSGSDPLATVTHVYRGTGNGSQTLLATIQDPLVTAYTDTSVQPGLTYSYRVAWASNCADGPSTPAATVTLPGTPPPPAPEAVTATLHAYPNPAREGSSVNLVLDVKGSASQHAYVRLYDLNGHWIADLVDATFPPGESEVVWPRTSRAGRTVAPGYYEALGTIGSVKVRERILLLP
jgi:hypothetical protein